MSPRVVFLAFWFSVCGCAAPDGARSMGAWVLFDGASLEGWERTKFGGEGEVRVEQGEVILEPGSPLTGLRWIGLPGTRETLPRSNFELSLTAARLDGTDFFCGMTFPVGGTHVTLILGGWGSSLCGLSCVDGMDAARNETRTFRSFETGRRYSVRIEVTEDRVGAWLDDVRLIDLAITGRVLSLRPEVELSAPLGVASFATRAAIGPIRLRRLDPASVSQGR